MANLELSAAAQYWVNVVLIWVGFGALAGLLAKALVPGRDPGGVVGVLVAGITGSTLGPLILSIILKRETFNPIGPLGLLAATGGACALLIGQRLLIALLPSSFERSLDP